MAVTTTYGADRGEHTVMPREGINIGAPGDFWGDVNAVRRGLRPLGNGLRQQADAVRGPGGWQTGPSGPSGPSPDDMYEPTFGTLAGMGPNSGGVAYQPYNGGPASPNSIVATGYRRRGASGGPANAVIPESGGRGGGGGGGGDVGGFSGASPTPGLYESFSKSKSKSPGDV